MTFSKDAIMKSVQYGELIDRIVSELDVSDPVLFLSFLKSIIKIDRQDSDVNGDIFLRRLPKVREYLPKVFSIDSKISCLYMELLLDSLGIVYFHDGLRYYDLPIIWFRVFHSLHRAGWISADAWGRSARCIYMHRRCPLPDVDEQADFRAALLEATPYGLMRTKELATLEQLPSTVTIYRGGSADSLDPAKAIQEMSQGLSWALDMDIAHSYMVTRTHQRKEDPNRGLSVLLEATVKRSAILALWLYPPDGRELLVDFGQISKVRVRKISKPISRISWKADDRRSLAA